MNGERLRQVRLLRRLTQQELAARVEVSQATISQIEAGIKGPSGELADAIAEAADFPLEFLEQPSGPELPLGSLSFRARRSVARRHLEEVCTWAAIALECVQVLARRFELASVQIPQIEDAGPEEAARVTRSAIGLAPHRPIPNLTYAMEQAGATVLAIPIPLDGRDAFSTWPSEPRPRPLVATCTVGVPGDRLRYSLAHELGHIVLHRGLRGTIKQVENEANRFAAELLMPADVIVDDLSRPVTIRSLSSIKLRWGVSVAALVMRARTLGVISERKAGSLFAEINRTWGRSSPEPIQVPVEKPRMFRKLAEAEYGEPPDAKRFASDFALPVHLAASLLGTHATRSEVVAVTPPSMDEADVVRLPRSPGTRTAAPSSPTGRARR